MGYEIPESFHGLRADVRFPTDFRATLHWSDNVEAVEIADIADQGVRLIGETLPVVGAYVQVSAKGLDERGRVMWRTAHSCGILLARRINALGVVRANCFPVRHRDDRGGDSPSVMAAGIG